MPLKAMKGHAVAEFIMDHAIVKASQNYVEPESWKLYFDVSSIKLGLVLEF